MSEPNSTIPTFVPAFGDILDRNGVPRQLLNLNTTTVNQQLGLPGLFSTFGPRDLRNMRILALTASSASIVACAISIFFLINIDRRKRVFRHDLVFFLIICDLVKALVLMIYPLVILVRNEVYDQPGFYNTLGWFTAYCVEGADLAIFFFAIHFALLIFIPSWKWRHRGSGRMEGGLYCVRAYIWPITALIPVLLASLAFVNFSVMDEQTLKENTTVVDDNNNYRFPYNARIGGYKPYSAWCYLPPFPAWYKLVLSWGPRYFLIVFILALYIAIYVFVWRESNKIKNQIFEFKERSEERQAAEMTSKKELFKFNVRRYFLRPLVRFILSFVSFLSFSFEDGSSSPKGAGSLYSSGSFYATEDSTSSDQVPNVKMSFDFPLQMKQEKLIYSNANGRKLSFGSRGRMSTVGDVESQRKSDSGNNDGSRSDFFLDELDPAHDEAPQAFVAQTAESISGQARPPGRTYLSPIQSLRVSKRKEDEQGDQYEMNKAAKNAQGSTANVKDVQASFQKQTYASMKKRRAQIQKNLRSIFIYPFSYIAIWIFPLIVDITQYHYEIVNGPIVWLVYIATIAQPLNGLVDTLVFVYREKPWNCSWKTIQTKELLDAYSLKGGFSEKDINDLYHSDLGKKGWYYCGRFDKFSCWKHKPQRWKRAAWYVHKFLQGMVKNDYNFEDHCDELALVHSELHTEGRLMGSSVVKNPYDQRERQVSFPSDSTTTSAPLAHQNSNRESNEHLEVPLFWRCIHLLPMLHGIDLDEVNRELRHKSEENDFELPGLKQALKWNTTVGTKKTDGATKPIFKPGYTVAKKASNSKLTEGEIDFTDRAQMNCAELTLNPNLDFSDVVRAESPGSVEQDHQEGNTASSEGGRMGMLAFLNDIKR